MSTAPRPHASPALPRRWHRTIATTGFVLLAYWALAGVTLALYDATDPDQVWAIQGGGPGARLEDGAEAARPLTDADPAAPGLDAALRDWGPAAPASVDLRWVGGRLRLQLARAGGSRADMRRYDARSGVRLAGEEGEPQAAAPPARVERRNTLKSWHKGDAAGLAGQFAGLLAGLTLLATAGSGTWLYLRSWRSRVHHGQPGFFWRPADSTWRRLHRGVAICASVFLLNIAITGSVLAIAEIQLALFLEHGLGVPPYPRPSALPPVSEGPVAPDVAAGLQALWHAAGAAAPGQPLVALQLVRRGGHAEGLAVLAARPARVLAFDMAAGAPLQDAGAAVQAGAGYFADWHQVLKRMHRGDIVGCFAGRAFDLAAGACLLYLLASGAVMYLGQRRRRAAQGARGWVWR